MTKVISHLWELYYSNGTDNNSTKLEYKLALFLHNQKQCSQSVQKCDNDMSHKKEYYLYYKFNQRTCV